MFMLSQFNRPASSLFVFFFNDTATTEIYTFPYTTLFRSLPISWAGCRTPASPTATGTAGTTDRKSTRLNSSHLVISYAVFCLKKKKNPRSPAPVDFVTAVIAYDAHPITSHTACLLRQLAH